MSTANADRSKRGALLVETDHMYIGEQTSDRPPSHGLIAALV
jgi:hypothetical protein